MDVKVNRRQKVLRWVLRQPGIISAIAGDTQIAQLQEAIAAAEQLS